MKLKSINAILLFLLLILIIIIKFFLFKNTLPGIDQAFFINWYQDLSNIENFFSKFPDYYNLTNIIRDETSLLNQIIIKLYNSPDQYFRTFNNLFFFTLTTFFGNEFQSFNLTSIIFNTSFLFLFIYSYISNKIDFITCLILSLYFSSNLYLFFYSPLGTHNFSALMLLFSMSYLLSQNLSENKIFNFKIWTAIIVAFLSHIINAFILTTFITFIILNETKLFSKKNIQKKIINLLFIYSIYIPFILITLLSNNFNRMISFSELNSSEFYFLYSSFIIFISNITKILSYYDLIFIFIIIFFLKSNFKKFNYIIVFFLSAIIVFLLVPGFSTGWERTLVYTYIPFIILVYFFLKNYINALSKLKIYFIYIFLILLSMINTFKIYDIVKRNDFNYLYKVNYKFENTISNIDEAAILQSNENLKVNFNSIVFYNYHSLHFYKSIMYEEKNKFESKNNNLIIDTFISRKEKGASNLLKYLNIRDKNFPVGDFNIFVFIPENLNYMNNICQYLNFMKLDCKKINIKVDQKIKYVTKYNKMYKLVLLNIKNVI